MTAPFFEVENLYVSFAGRQRLFQPTMPSTKAVNGISFTIEPRRTFGLVGESGSGKSTVARAILQLTPISAGRIRLDGVDVTRVQSDDELAFRKRVQAVLQDPFSSLNQVHQVRTIVGDGITRHFGIKPGPEREQRILGLLDEVGLTGEFLDRYPYEMSGGQRQRVSIARSLAVEPDLIIADEATSALDVSIQSQVINVLRRVQADTGVGILFIGHDLEVVRHMSDDVGVMYLGFLVEAGAAEGVYESPSHPYTEMLIASAPVPDPEAQEERRRLRRTFRRDTEPPSPSDLPPGCPFESRCPVSMDICSREMPTATVARHGGYVRCHLHTSGPILAGESVVDFIRSATTRK
ncbi:oligopeptide/dipeptide ABC transporter ATP-binding protein [Candidatus Poriferisodalis sp.]|uniref:oligopeptide/dipeptide ABC transporter ATP-binding protein n=1 Tax=Candidatus Poriferisodalis sp. TaxID=3101277 RepID=UPI003B51B3AD